MRSGLGVGLTYPTNAGRAAGGVAYVGPLDLYSTGIVICCSASRALSSAMRGQPLYTLKKLDGGAEPSQEFNSDASTGAAPSAAITAFLSGEDGLLMIFNDQSGAGMELTDPSGAALWGASVIGGKPGFTGTGIYESGDEPTFPNGECTIFLVANEKTEVAANTSGQGYTRMQTDLPDIDMFRSVGGREAGGAINNPSAGIHLWDAAWKFGQRSFKVDGEAQSFIESYDSGGQVPSFIGEIECRFEASGAVIVEFLIFNAIIPDAERDSIRQNIAAYYGITLAP